MPTKKAIEFRGANSAEQKMTGPTILRVPSMTGMVMVPVTKVARGTAYRHQNGAVLGRAIRGAFGPLDGEPAFQFEQPE